MNVIIGSPLDRCMETEHSMTSLMDAENKHGNGPTEKAANEPWYLDGTYALDGKMILNAYKETEVL